MNAMGARGRRRGGQAEKERQRIELDRRGAVRERSLEDDTHESVAEPTHSLLRQRGPQHVFAEGFASARILRLEP